ncbi:MAG: 1,4-alpha-glucan-branching enzyme, partial [Clostridiales bacterium]|nr:1,4-alpha-glucan-branching enzyme [Clostridiales bacterium]
MDRYAGVRKALLGEDGDISSFANAHLYFGIFRCQGGWVYREWAPAAEAMHLFGDFNGWDPWSVPMKRLENGVWEVFLPGEDALRHGQKIKVRVTHGGVTRDRIPLYIRYVVQDEGSTGFSGVV